MITSIPMIIHIVAEQNHPFPFPVPWSFVPCAEFMLCKCDSVHSGVAMAFIAVAIVGMCIVSTLGLMGYFQVPNGTPAMVEAC